MLEAQKLLTDLGYNPGIIDGAYGRKTEKAIINFYLDRGLKFDGSFSKNEINDLKAQAELNLEYFSALSYFDREFYESGLDAYSLEIACPEQLPQNFDNLSTADKYRIYAQQTCTQDGLEIITSYFEDVPQKAENDIIYEFIFSYEADANETNSSELDYWYSINNVFDFNQDGLDDIVLGLSNANSGESIEKVYFLASNGHGFDRVPIEFHGEKFLFNPGVGEFIDLDSDGKTDFLMRSPYGSNGLNQISDKYGSDSIVIFWNDGQKFTAEQITKNNKVLRGGRSIFLDYNGDGRTDIISIPIDDRDGNYFFAQNLGNRSFEISKSLPFELPIKAVPFESLFFFETTLGKLLFRVESNISADNSTLHVYQIRNGEITLFSSVDVTASKYEKFNYTEQRKGMRLDYDIRAEHGFGIINLDDGREIVAFIRTIHNTGWFPRFYELSPNGLLDVTSELFPKFDFSQFSADRTESGLPKYIDLNADGHRDFFFGNGRAMKRHLGVFPGILFSDGNNHFSPAPSFYFASLLHSRSSLHLGDFNGDGQIDLAVLENLYANLSSNSENKIFRCSNCRGGGIGLRVDYSFWKNVSRYRQKSQKFTDLMKKIESENSHPNDNKWTMRDSFDALRKENFCIRGEVQWALAQKLNPNVCAGGKLNFNDGPFGQFNNGAFGINADIYLGNQRNKFEAFSKKHYNMSLDDLLEKKEKFLPGRFVITPYEIKASGADGKIQSKIELSNNKELLSANLEWGIEFEDFEMIDETRFFVNIATPRCEVCESQVRSNQKYIGDLSIGFIYPEDISKLNEFVIFGINKDENAIKTVFNPLSRDKAFEYGSLFVKGLKYSSDYSLEQLVSSYGNSFKFAITYFADGIGNRAHEHRLSFDQEWQFICSFNEDACQKFLDNNEGSRVKVSSEKIVNLEYSVPICDGCDEFEEQTFSGNLSDGILLPEKPTKAGQWVFFIMKAD